ncbi:MAG: GTP cyclohydrolase II [Candidatus Hodarchaeota archaeon]
MKKLSLEEILKQDLHDFKNCSNDWDCENCSRDLCVHIAAVADFPSLYGTFQIVGFINNKDKKEHIAIVKGEVLDSENVLTRLHSACLTGDALGSKRCDCGPQLRTALLMIEKEGQGTVLYLQQEGRGIGLLNKLRAYSLQDEGLDTYDANTMLGFAPDARDYEIAAIMLKKLSIKSIRLLTNNPEKINQLKKYDVEIVERVSIELPTYDQSAFYMETKKQRFGHLLSHTANGEE